MPLPKPDISEYTSPEIIEELRGREDFELLLDEMSISETLNISKIALKPKEVNHTNETDRKISRQYAHAVLPERRSPDDLEPSKATH